MCCALFVIGLSRTWIACSKVVSLDRLASSTPRQSSGSWLYKCIWVFVNADKVTQKCHFLMLLQIHHERKKGQSAVFRIIQACQVKRLLLQEGCNLMQFRLNYLHLFACLILIFLLCPALSAFWLPPKFLWPKRFWDFKLLSHNNQKLRPTQVTFSLIWLTQSWWLIKWTHCLAVLCVIEKR